MIRIARTGAQVSPLSRAGILFPDRWLLGGRAMPGKVRRSHFLQTEKLREQGLQKGGTYVVRGRGERSHMVATKGMHITYISIQASNQNSIERQLLTMEGGIQTQPDVGITCDEENWFIRRPCRTRRE